MNKILFAAFLAIPALAFTLHEGMGSGPSDSPKTAKTAAVSQHTAPAPVAPAQQEAAPRSLAAPATAPTGEKPGTHSQAELKKAFEKEREEMSGFAFYDEDVQASYADEYDESVVSDALRDLVNEALANPAQEILHKKSSMEYMSRCPSGTTFMLTHAVSDDGFRGGYLIDRFGCDERGAARFMVNEAERIVLVRLTAEIGYIPVKDWLDMLKRAES